VSAPCVVALIAPKFKKSFLQALHNKEVLVVPVVTIFLEEPGKGLLRRPLNAYPLEDMVLSVVAHHGLVLDGELSVNVIFNLLDRRVPLQIYILI
jgi:hypothetical protein